MFILIAGDVRMSWSFGRWMSGSFEWIARTDSKSCAKHPVDPGGSEAREQDWLRNMTDWMISKKRFWGLALRFGVPECSHFMVIGGRDELSTQREGWEVFESTRRTGAYRCCKGQVRKVWRDRFPIRGCRQSAAGRVCNYRYHGHVTDRAYWEKWFPADLVLKFPGQFRNWFYSMLAMSAMLDGRCTVQGPLGSQRWSDARGE
jgi:isoleucyl-tRNA synthetase